MYDFFISHSSKDKNSIVDDLVDNLQYMGYNVWYDRDKILVSDNIIESIKKGLTSSYCIIIVVTDNFFESKWTFYETGFFDASNRNCIIPLLYNISEKNKVQLFNIIGNIKYLDMNTMTKETVAAELVKILRRTQVNNSEIDTVEHIRKIQKQLATYETVNSEIISLLIKEYLSILETKKDYLILAAKKIVKTVSKDLLAHKKIDVNDDNSSILEMLKDHNIGSINFREHINFILSFNIEENINSDYLIIINRSLLNVLTYYIHSRYPFKLLYEQIEIVSPEELTYSDFEDMYEIDKKVMREDLVADVKTTYAWYEYNQYTHIGVKNTTTNKLIGYFAVLPITNETYNQIVSGKFKDNEFNPENLKQYIFSDFYKVYVAGVGIDPKYQNTGAFIMLYNALIDLVIILAKEREIYISEVLAEASTKQGEKFCKMVGMKKITSTQNETDVYRLVTIPPEFRHTGQKGKELYALCKNKFEEYRDYFTRE